MKKLPLLSHSLELEGSDLDSKKRVKSALIHSRGLETRRDDISHALKGGGGGHSKNFVVSGQMNGTDTVRKSMKRTSGRHRTRGTSELFPREKSRTTTFSALASLAQRLASLEKGRDLRTLEGLSFLKSLGLRETKDPDIYFSKMSKVYLVTRREKLSRLYLGFLPTWGIDVNGRYLTAGISAFPRTGNECSLSDVLEENPNPKYFLSEKQTKWARQALGRMQLIPTSARESGDTDEEL